MGRSGGHDHNTIRIRGAREHNLRNVDLELPRDKLIVFTGLVGFGEVVARVRHDLRRGPAPLRRVAVGVRPPVPRPDGQARRRLHRGPLAGDLDRPEVGVAQPAVDRRHHHRDLRLPAPALRAHRRAALPELRSGDHPPDAAADRRPRAATRGGHTVPGARAGRARPQGRVRGAAEGAGVAGLHPGAGRRRAGRAGRGHQRAPRPLREPHHRGRRRPAGAPHRDRASPHRLAGDRVAARRGRRRGRDRAARRRARRRRSRRSRSPSTSRARTAACRSTSSRRATSRSTRRTARASGATVSARASRSIPSCSSPTTT